MRKPASPHFTLEQPWENDDFDRRRFGEALLGLVESLEQPFTISMEAQWGGGKSTLIDRLVKVVNAGSGPMIACSYDAWKGESVGDPIGALTLAIAQTLDGRIESAIDAGPSIIDRLRTSAKVTTSKLAAWSKPAINAISLALAADGSITPDDAKALQVATSAASDMAGAIAKELDDPKAIRQDFRATLESAVSRIRAQREGPGCKLLVFVDELDRCRPDYCVQILERLKHFFDVPGVVFVLACDPDYLVSAVRAVYGASFDAENYLRRFIEFEVRMPPPALIKHFERLWDAFEFPNLFGERSKWYFAQIVPFVESTWTRMSLRDREQAMMRLRLVMSTAKGNDAGFALIMFATVFIRSAAGMRRAALDAAPLAQEFSRIASLIGASAKRDQLAVHVLHIAARALSGERELYRTLSDELDRKRDQNSLNWQERNEIDLQMELAASLVPRNAPPLVDRIESALCGPLG